MSGMTSEDQRRKLEPLCRIVVENLQHNVKEEVILKAFLPFGPVEDVVMVQQPGQGTTSSVAFIDYEMPEAAQLAIDYMNGTTFNGQCIKIIRPKNVLQRRIKERQSHNVNAIYVASIHEKLGESAIKSVFESFGKVIQVTVPPDQNNPAKHRGFAYIEYKSSESALSALKSMNLLELAGQLLFVGKVIFPPYKTIRAGDESSESISLEDIVNEVFLPKHKPTTTNEDIAKSIQNSVKCKPTKATDNVSVSTRSFVEKKRKTTASEYISVKPKSKRTARVKIFKPFKITAEKKPIAVAANIFESVEHSVEQEPTAIGDSRELVEPYVQYKPKTTATVQSLKSIESSIEHRIKNTAGITQSVKNNMTKPTANTTLLFDNCLKGKMTKPPANTTQLIDNCLEGKMTKPPANTTQLIDNCLEGKMTKPPANTTQLIDNCLEGKMTKPPASTTQFIDNCLERKMTKPPVKTAQLSDNSLKGKMTKPPANTTQLSEDCLERKLTKPPANTTQLIDNCLEGKMTKPPANTTQLIDNCLERKMSKPPVKTTQLSDNCLKGKMTKPAVNTTQLSEDCLERKMTKPPANTTQLSEDCLEIKLIKPPMNTTQLSDNCLKRKMTKTPQSIGNSIKHNTTKTSANVIRFIKNCLKRKVLKPTANITQPVEGSVEHSPALVKISKTVKQNTSRVNIFEPFKMAVENKSKTAPCDIFQSMEESSEEKNTEVNKEILKHESVENVSAEEKVIAIVKSSKSVEYEQSKETVDMFVSIDSSVALGKSSESTRCTFNEFTNDKKLSGSTVKLADASVHQIDCISDTSKKTNIKIGTMVVSAHETVSNKKTTGLISAKFSPGGMEVHLTEKDHITCVKGKTRMTKSEQICCLPKIPKVGKDLLDVANLYEKEEVLAIVNKSRLYSDEKWNPVEVTMINNTDLAEKYNDRKNAMRSDLGKKPLQEVYMFLVRENVKELAENGVAVNMAEASVLGDSALGVHLFRHADVCLDNARLKSLCCEGNLLLVKVFIGRSKAVAVNASVALEPTPNYHSHVPTKLAEPTDDIFTAVQKSQVYVYEYSEDYEPVKIPRQCLPYATVKVQYTYDARKINGYSAHCNPSTSMQPVTSRNRSKGKHYTPMDMCKNDVQRDTPSGENTAYVGDKIEEKTAHVGDKTGLKLAGSLNVMPELCSEISLTSQSSNGKINVPNVRDPRLKLLKDQSNIRHVSLKVSQIHQPSLSTDQSRELKKEQEVKQKMSMNCKNQETIPNEETTDVDKKHALHTVNPKAENLSSQKTRPCDKDEIIRNPKPQKRKLCDEDEIIRNPKPLNHLVKQRLCGNITFDKSQSGTTQALDTSKLKRKECSNKMEKNNLEEQYKKSMKIKAKYASDNRKKFSKGSVEYTRSEKKLRCSMNKKSTTKEVTVNSSSQYKVFGGCPDVDGKSQNPDLKGNKHLKNGKMIEMELSEEYTDVNGKSQNPDLKGDEHLKNGKMIEMQHSEEYTRREKELRHSMIKQATAEEVTKKSSLQYKVAGGCPDVHGKSNNLGLKGNKHPKNGNTIQIQDSKQTCIKVKDKYASDKRKKFSKGSGESTQSEKEMRCSMNKQSSMQKAAEKSSSQCKVVHVCPDVNSKSQNHALRENKLSKNGKIIPVQDSKQRCIKVQDKYVSDKKRGHISKGLLECTSSGKKQNENKVRIITNKTNTTKGATEKDSQKTGNQSNVKDKTCWPKENTAPNEMNMTQKSVPCVLIDPNNNHQGDRVFSNRSQKSTLGDEQKEGKLNNSANENSTMEIVTTETISSDSSHGNIKNDCIDVKRKEITKERKGSPKVAIDQNNDNKSDGSMMMHDAVDGGNTNLTGSFPPQEHPASLLCNRNHGGTMTGKMSMGQETLNGENFNIDQDRTEEECNTGNVSGEQLKGFLNSTVNEGYIWLKDHFHHEPSKQHNQENDSNCSSQCYAEAFSHENGTKNYATALKSDAKTHVKTVDTETSIQCQIKVPNITNSCKSQGQISSYESNTGCRMKACEYGSCTDKEVNTPEGGNIAHYEGEIPQKENSKNGQVQLDGIQNSTRYQMKIPITSSQIMIQNSPNSSGYKDSVYRNSTQEHVKLPDHGNSTSHKRNIPDSGIGSEVHVMAPTAGNVACYLVNIPRSEISTNCPSMPLYNGNSARLRDIHNSTQYQVSQPGTSFGYEAMKPDTLGGNPEHRVNVPMYEYWPNQLVNRGGQETEICVPDTGTYSYYQTLPETEYSTRYQVQIPDNENGKVNVTGTENDNQNVYWEMLSRNAKDIENQLNGTNYFVDVPISVNRTNNLLAAVCENRGDDQVKVFEQDIENRTNCQMNELGNENQTNCKVQVAEIEKQHNFQEEVPSNDNKTNDQRMKNDSEKVPLYEVLLPNGMNFQVTIPENQNQTNYQVKVEGNGHSTEYEVKELNSEKNEGYRVKVHESPSSTEYRVKIPDSENITEYKAITTDNGKTTEYWVKIPDSPNWVKLSSDGKDVRKQVDVSQSQNSATYEAILPQIQNSLRYQVPDFGSGKESWRNIPYCENYTEPENWSKLFAKGKDDGNKGYVPYYENNILYNVNFPHSESSINFQASVPHGENNVNYGVNPGAVDNSHLYRTEDKILTIGNRLVYQQDIPNGTPTVQSQREIPKSANIKQGMDTSSHHFDNIKVNTFQQYFGKQLRETPSKKSSVNSGNYSHTTEEGLWGKPIGPSCASQLPVGVGPDQDLFRMDLNSADQFVSFDFCIKEHVAVLNALLFTKYSDVSSSESIDETVLTRYSFPSVKYRRYFKPRPLDGENLMTFDDHICALYDEFKRAYREYKIIQGHSKPYCSTTSLQEKLLEEAPQLLYFLADLHIVIELAVTYYEVTCGSEVHRLSKWQKDRIGELNLQFNLLEPEDVNKDSVARFQQNIHKVNEVLFIPCLPVDSPGNRVDILRVLLGKVTIGAKMIFLRKKLLALTLLGST